MSEIHTQWDIAFCEQYVADANAMVPRSLRWDVSPQKGELELQECFKYFNKAVVKFFGIFNPKKE